MNNHLATYIQHLTYTALSITHYNAARTTWYQQLAAYVRDASASATTTPHTGE